MAWTTCATRAKANAKIIRIHNLMSASVFYLICKPIKKQDIVCFGNREIFQMEIIINGTAAAMKKYTIFPLFKDIEFAN